MAFSNEHFKILDIKGTQYYLSARYMLDANGNEFDIQSKIQYIELSDGIGTLTDEQFNTLFQAGGYTCIVYNDSYSTSILERVGIVGTNFIWACAEVVGNDILQKQVSVNYQTKAWEYSVQELEEKIDVVQIDTSTLPKTLDQITYNTLFSSKLNKILDISVDPITHYTRNRLYSYIDDVFDSDNQILYSHYSCFYVDDGSVVDSVITINRSNGSCSAPVAISLAPSGGSKWQVLTKLSNANGDIGWKDAHPEIKCTNASNTPFGIKWDNGTDITGTLSASTALDTYGPRVFFLVPSTTVSGHTEAHGEYEVSLDGNYIFYTLDTQNDTFIKLTTTTLDVRHRHSITWPNKKKLSATASGASLSTNTDTFVKSYPGEFNTLETTSITGTKGTQTVSKVTKTDGSAATWNYEVDNDGILSFTFTANTPTAVSVTDYTVATRADSAITVATGTVSSSGQGSTVMVGLGNPTTANSLTSASVASQPTITLDDSGNTGIEFVQDVPEYTDTTF